MQDLLEKDFLIEIKEDATKYDLSLKRFIALGLLDTNLRQKVVTDSRIKELMIKPEQQKEVHGIVSFFRSQLSDEKRSQLNGKSLQTFMIGKNIVFGLYEIGILSGEIDFDQASSSWLSDWILEKFMIITYKTPCVSKGFWRWGGDLNPCRSALQADS